MVDIVEIYLETGDFHEAVKQSGEPEELQPLLKDYALLRKNGLF